MADELDIGRNVAYQLVQQPGFPAFTIGRRVLVSRKGLQEWIDSQCKNRSNVIEESEP
ncbi:MAG: helix-turn-helix domain-containing protein [Verrucomicrobia bacterium]|nr:helix-turn-helix domain-containing protein [Verrucomicrobiota bacterium]